MQLRLVDLFRSFDKDGSGSVSRAEFIRGLEVRLLHFFARLARVVDVDVVVVDDSCCFGFRFLLLLLNLTLMLSSLTPFLRLQVIDPFSSSSSQSNGIILEEELLDELLDYLDTDGDGEIDYKVTLWLCLSLVSLSFSSSPICHE